jgi:hypothetical protein
MTYGEKTVRISFNPSTYSSVDNIKQSTAELIDNLIEYIKEKTEKMKEEYLEKEDTNEKFQSDRAEIHRILGKAVDHYETAVMYAVKALST